MADRNKKGGKKQNKAPAAKNPAAGKKSALQNADKIKKIKNGAEGRVISESSFSGASGSNTAPYGTQRRDKSGGGNAAVQTPFNPYEPVPRRQFYNYNDYSHPEKGAQSARPANAASNQPQNARYGSAAPNQPRNARPASAAPNQSRNARPASAAPNQPRNARPASAAPNQPRNARPASAATNQSRNAQPRNAQPRNAARNNAGQPAGRTNPTIRDQVRAQNPEIRRAEQKRRRLNPHEIEIRRRQEAARRFYIKKQRQNAIRVFFGRFIVFLCMFTVMMAASLIIFFVNLYSNSAQSDRSVDYRIGYKGYDDSTLHTYKFGYLFNRGELYINMTELADYCGFITTGDVNELKYIASISVSEDGTQTGENIKFMLGTSAAYVNDVAVRLPAPVIVRGADNNTVWIPLDAVNDYFIGVKAEYYAEGRTLNVTRDTVNDISDGSDPIYTDISFALHSDEGSEHIIEGSLSENVLASSDPSPVTSDTGGDENTVKLN